MATIAELLVKISGDSSGLRKELAASQRQIQRAYGSAALEVSQTAIQGLGVLSAAMAAVGVAAIKMSADFAASKTAFTTLLGSAAEAEAMLNDLASFAASTPFELPGLIKSSQKLLAFQFAAQDIIPIMNSVGNAIALVGGGQEAIDGVVRALGQMKAKGKLSAEEMNQLSERGINGWKYIADSMGISVAEVMKLSEKGAIDATTAINAVVLGMQSKFTGGMDAMSKTVPGLLSTIKDNAGMVMKQIGDELTINLNLQENLQSIADSLTKFSNAVKVVGLKDALTGLIPPALIQSVFVLSGAIIAAAIPAMTMFALSAWAALVPLLPLIAKGMAVGAVAYLIWRNWEPLSDLFKSIYEVFSTVWQGIAQIVSNRVTLVTSFITDSWNFVYNTTTKVWNSIVSTLSDAWNYVSAIVTDNLGWAINYIVDCWNVVYNSTADAWSGVTDWIDQAWTNIKNIVANGVKWVVDSIKPLLDLMGISTSGISNFLDKTASSLDKVKKAASGLNLGFSKKDIEGLIPQSKSVNTTFTGLHGADSNKPTGGSTGNDKAEKEYERLEEKAKQTSKSIRNEWIQLTGTKIEALNSWRDDELEKLEESKSANENYQRDLMRLDEIYAEKKKKILSDQQKEENKIYDNAFKDANDYKNKLNSISLEGVDKQKFDIETSATEQITNIKNKYRDLTQEFANSTAEQKAIYKKAWEDNGILFEEVEKGKISFSKEILKQTETIEKEKNQKIKDLHYDRVKYQEDLDKAYAEGDLARYKELLSSKQAHMQNELKGQQELADLYKSVWEAAHLSVGEAWAAIGTASFETLKSGISDMIMGVKSIADVWNSLGQTIAKVIADMVAQWIAGRIMMAVMGGDSMGAQTTQSVAAAGTTAAAWAPAAAMVSLASFGQNAIPAMAGIAATNLLSIGFAGPKLATGGITTGPTLAEIGEGHYKEAVLPLNKKTFEKVGLIGGENQVQPIFSINISAVDSNDVERLFNNHGDKIVKSLSSQYRKFNTGGLRK